MGGTPAAGRRGVVALRGALGAGLVVLVAACAGSTPDQPDTAGIVVAPLPGSAAADEEMQRRLVADVSGAGAEPHLQALQRIADANGGTRVSPGPGYDASVDYVAGVLRDAGYDVSTPTFTVEMPHSDQEVTLRNVIAQTLTGDPHRVVVAGAHLDSVPDGPGINDDGTGVAALLELATRLGATPPVTNAVRFAFWGSEENHLDGSTAYLDDLPTPQRNDLMMYLNLDMLGSPNGGYFVQGGVGQDWSETGPPGSERVAQEVVQQLQRTGVAAQTIPFDDGSDFAPFLDAGVPTAGVASGDRKRKTVEQAAQWGGRAGEPFDPCYHAACDRMDAIDHRTFDRMTDAAAGTVAYFATVIEAPSR